jgi:hypothetical protein
LKPTETHETKIEEPEDKNFTKRFCLENPQYTSKQNEILKEKN